MSYVLSISQARADLLAQLAVKHRVRDLDRLRQLPQVAGWRPEILDDAIDRNVAAGVFTEDAHGRLCVNPKSKAAPGVDGFAKTSETTLDVSG